MNALRLLALLALVMAGGARAEDVLIRTREGATLSAIVAKPDSAERVPTLLEFTIYVDADAARAQVAEIAARGYAGVVAFVRGKYQSPDEPVPYEHDATDTHAVLDWIARQPWSNGKVGMIGGSYSGFTAWAAAKRRHPALAAIAVSAAAIPGQGLPMQNNVFVTDNYAWPFYVTHNKTLDEALYADNARWNRFPREWFASGRPYREIDAVEGTPNPWLQRWLQHPDFDRYWQGMTAYGNDFARIGIPALTITGYYDDAQISALEYFKEHVKRAREAEHYLVIGPYDHRGTHWRQKPTELRGYTLDAVAQLDSQELKLAFMDHVLRGKPKPGLLGDRVNFEVMGANEWRHAPSLGAMHGIPMRLYFSHQKDGEWYSLPNRQPTGSRVVHEVDLADRVKYHNFHAFPLEIVQGPLQMVTESVFATAPFQAATGVMGEFEGELLITTNKRDFDLGITVFEAMPDGRLFHLARALQRASYSESREKRRLLSPGKEQRVRFVTSLVARRMQAGSRLLVLVDVNKHPFAQINYGTGKDVSDESVKDAGEPLRIEIRSGSYLEVPLDNTIVRPKPAG
ncbi:MAG TPA: CocE/NonD family hydrolase [Steroidobacteraceae bacterium]